MYGRLVGGSAADAEPKAWRLTVPGLHFVSQQTTSSLASRAGGPGKDLEATRLRKLIVLPGMVFLVALTTSPAAALAAAKGTDRPLTGISSGTLTVTLGTGGRD